MAFSALWTLSVPLTAPHPRPHLLPEGWGEHETPSYEESSKGLGWGGLITESQSRRLQRPLCIISSHPLVFTDEEAEAQRGR